MPLLVRLFGRLGNCKLLQPGSESPHTGSSFPNQHIRSRTAAWPTKHGARLRPTTCTDTPRCDARRWASVATAPFSGTRQRLAHHLRRLLWSGKDSLRARSTADPGSAHRSRAAWARNHSASQGLAQPAVATFRRVVGAVPGTRSSLVPGPQSTTEGQRPSMPPLIHDAEPLPARHRCRLRGVAAEGRHATRANDLLDAASGSSSASCGASSCACACDAS